MKFLYYLGIDIAKLTFDYAMISKDGTIISQGQVDNNVESISDWLECLKSKHPFSWKNTLVCMEHSGYYNNRLLKTMYEKVKANVWVESALQIKRSGGIQRGKDDPMDALRIASYALDFQRKAKLWQPRSKSLERLALLVSHRDQMVKNHMSIANTLKEEESLIDDELHDEMESISRATLAAMKKAIDKFDKRIEQLLEEDIKLSRQSEIIQSIPGFGQVIASKMIIITEGFSRLQNPRALACFAGVAPFSYQSGTSIRGKTRISHFANKEIKKMLHLAALVIIRKNNIMH